MSSSLLLCYNVFFCHTLKEKEDGTLGDLLIKQANSDKATVQATDDYAERVSIDDDLSLLITGASLKDQNTFTCMVVSDSNLLEYPVTVLVNSKTSSLLSLSTSSSLLLIVEVATFFSLVLKKNH